MRRAGSAHEPSFIGGHPRSPMHTVQSEMRNLAVAIESFRVFEGRLPTPREYYDATHKTHDTGVYPPILKTLTSPVSHIAALPGDPFFEPKREYHYCYYSDNDCWILGSAGPDGKIDFFSGPSGGYKNEKLWAAGIPGVASPCDPRFFYPARLGGVPGMIDYLYDPTNGVKSRGDIIKTGP